MTYKKSTDPLDLKAMNPLREKCIHSARTEVQDCLIVGAGINGAVSAAALTGRGLKVTIIDRADFASFTSQESSNLAWGGIKYLETGEFRLVRNLCRSRNRLMNAYPTQVRETRFFTSVAKGFRKPCIVLYAGAWLYWFIGRCRTRPPRRLTRRIIQKEEPAVRTDRLSGGLEYSDCRFEEYDARFTFGFIRKVIANGGQAINYLELISADRRDGIWHCALRDQVTGQAFGIRAKTLINAAGPFADRVNELIGIRSSFRHIFSKGIHIIVPRITESERVLTFFASDGRLFFMIPMGSRTCVGTTDTRVESGETEATPEDVHFLLENANALLRLERPLTQDDVISKRCGVRPLVVKRNTEVGTADWTALSRRHEIDVHADATMLTIYGGKLTDCLNVGEKVSRVITGFGFAACEDNNDWYGEPDTAHRKRFEKEAAKTDLPRGQVDRLWRRYGEASFDLINRIKADPVMAQPVFGTLIRAELIFMVESEMVIYAADLLRRRTALALTVGHEQLQADPAYAELENLLQNHNSD